MPRLDPTLSPSQIKARVCAHNKPCAKALFIYAQAEARAQLYMLIVNCRNAFSAAVVENARFLARRAAAVSRLALKSYVDHLISETSGETPTISPHEKTIH